MQSLRDMQLDFGKFLLEAGGPATMRAGLRIYTGNVYGNWTKALESAYPIIRKIVGEPFFESLARAYARAHASVSGDLNEFGAHLRAFVARFPVYPGFALPARRCAHGVARASRALRRRRRAL